MARLVALCLASLCAAPAWAQPADQEVVDQTFTLPPFNYSGSRAGIPPRVPEPVDQVFTLEPFTYVGDRSPIPVAAPETVDQVFTLEPFSYWGGETVEPDEARCRPGGQMSVSLESLDPPAGPAADTHAFHRERVRFRSARVGFLDAEPGPGECALALSGFPTGAGGDLQLVHDARREDVAGLAAESGRELVSRIDLVEAGRPALRVTAAEGYLSGLVERFTPGDSVETVRLIVQPAPCEGACPEGALSETTYEVVRFLD